MPGENGASCQGLSSKAHHQQRVHVKQTSKKWPFYCPQGSGTLRQQLSIMHGIAWYSMGLHCMVCFCMELHGFAWYCMVLHHLALCCTMLHHVAPEYARVCHSMPEYAKVVHKLSPCHPQVVSKSSLVMPSGTHEASMKPAHRVQ